MQRERDVCVCSLLKIGVFHIQLFNLSLLYFLAPLDISGDQRFFFLTHPFNKYLLISWY